jgi:broad specificity polyphosphatase/5'/3'-nucleotidase SurE
MPPTTLLNVNYPAAGNTVVKTKFARLSRLRGFKVEYVESDKPDELRPKIGFETKVAAEPGTDRAFFDQGFVTISVLDGSLDQGVEGIEWIATRVNFESTKDKE